MRRTASAALFALGLLATNFGTSAVLARSSVAGLAATIAAANSAPVTAAPLPPATIDVQPMKAAVMPTRPEVLTAAISEETSDLAPVATPIAGEVTPVRPVAPIDTEKSSSPCAPDHTYCGAHPFATAPVCCPPLAICQRTAHSFHCVAHSEVAQCDACCLAGKCTHAIKDDASEMTAAEAGPGGVMVPKLRTLQCCGTGEQGQSFCCPTRSPSRTHPATGEEILSKAQKCAAIEGFKAWDCVDAPSSILMTTINLMAWQLALCVVGGVLCCGAMTGGGHRAYGGHCSNDCEALAACCAGCALFECCCAGGQGAKAPLLG